MKTMNSPGDKIIFYFFRHFYYVIKNFINKMNKITKVENQWWKKQKTHKRDILSEDNLKIITKLAKKFVKHYVCK